MKKRRRAVSLEDKRLADELVLKINRVCKFLGGFCKKKGGRYHPFSIRKKVVTGFGKCTGFNTFIVADGSAATNFLTVTAMFKVVKTI